MYAEFGFSYPPIIMFQNYPWTAKVTTFPLNDCWRTWDSIAFTFLTVPAFCMDLPPPTCDLENGMSTSTTRQAGSVFLLLLDVIPAVVIMISAAVRTRNAKQLSKGMCFLTALIFASSIFYLHLLLCAVTCCASFTIQ